MYREEEPQNNDNHKTPGRQTKFTDQLPRPSQGDCKTRKDTNHCNKPRTPTMGATINNKPTTTKSLT